MRNELASLALLQAVIDGSGGQVRAAGILDEEGLSPHMESGNDSSAIPEDERSPTTTPESVGGKPDLNDRAMDKCLASIRGHEGVAGREYFQLLARALNVAPGDLLHFDGRNRRPPRDPFNALLSFGYALLYRDCTGALLAVGLEPAVGVLHTPRSAAYPLALDLMELFRVILWDIPLVGSVNRRQWRREDFEFTGKQVWLNTNGRRKAIQLYESRKAEKWKHPVLDYSLSYARTIELEARLLEKEWTGHPGLFAKLRLR